MKKLPAIAALILTSNLAHAIPTTWELLNNNMDVVGTFQLDIATETTSNAQISGEIGFYTISSSFTFLNSSTYVGGYPVNNYMKFFSTEAGKVYRSDFGGGEYSEIRVNDAAIDIGTLGVLVPGGGLYDAYIHEIYNFDETSSYCAYYEEIYDDEGNYSQGPCVYYDQYSSYNNESGYWYEGYYLRSAAVVGVVPGAATGWLMLLGLAGLGISRRQGLRGQATR
jgi:hypothetical protein